MNDPLYSNAFFAFHEEKSRGSARETIPAIWQFVQPASVVDVGCGIGTWLSEFRAAGVDDYLGVDGEYVDRAKLLIEPARFMARDLAQPLALERRFDLAVSLEVAEHLPPESADMFVASLTALAPVVLFSAAIPHQAGDGHVNEQWPEYWRDIFRRRDYVVIDCLRRPLWNNPRISCWYRQNMLFFVDQRRLGDYPQLAAAFARQDREPPLSLVHPDFYSQLCDHMLGKYRDSQCLALRYALRLREINLAVLADWNQPPERILADLRALLSAVMARGDRHRFALAFHISNVPAREKLAIQMLGQLHAELQPYARQDSPPPELVAVGTDFGPDQWEVLRACLQGRVSLPREDATALAATGAGELPVFPL